MSWLADPTLAPNACDKTSRRLFNEVEPKRWVSFIAATTALYGLLYGAANLFNWEKDNKSGSDHYYQLLYVIILANFIFYFGNINNTISYWLLIGMLVGGFGIALIGSLPGFQFSTGSLANIRGIPLLTVVSISVLVLVGIFLTFRYYQKCGMTNLFLILFFVPIVILAISYLLSAIEGPTVEIHLHHWQWALLFVFFARFPGIPWQSFLTGAFVGIIIDGIGRYGPDPLFVPATP